MDNGSLPAADPRWAWFLDVDGTLIEIAKRPDAIRVDKRMVAAIGMLKVAARDAVALVSGRPIQELDRIFAPLHLAAAGLHGLERRDAAGRALRNAERDPKLDEAVTEMHKFALGHPGALIEDKGITVALHFRQVPEAADAAVRLVRDIAARDKGRFVVQYGKMVVELRPPGFDKGAVVEAFMAEPPFYGRMPVFIGDDATDEAGFAAANRLGGASVRVGGPAPTTARWRVGSVSALIDWLESASAALKA
jgi:trehalose 6-phosphate phosphatase